MSQRISVKVNEKDLRLNLHKKVSENLENLLDDDTVMLQIHSAFERYCEPYVPFLTGALVQTTNVTSEYVEYLQPYAHYQYVGEEFNHTLDYHPLATAYWDKVMMTNNGEAFLNEVRSLLIRRAKQLYG